MTNKLIYTGSALAALILIISAQAVIAAVNAVALPVAVGAGVFSVAAIAAVAISAAGRAWYALRDRHLDSRLKAADVEIRQAQAQAARRDSEIYVVTHRIDEGVIVRDDGGGVWHKPALDARAYTNGRPGQPTDAEMGAWLQWHQLHAKRPVAPELLPGPAPEALEPILPRLIRAQRLIVAGGSDAGKTTLIKHIIAGRADHSQIVVIDPHAPSKVLGFDVIGAGRDYEAIGEALRSLSWLMTTRYGDVAAGVLGYGQHRRISVFVDEWTSISQQVEDAGDLLKTLITESRKVNIHLTLCSHSTTVDVLGIDAQIRKSATIVELTGGNGEPRRAFIHPASKTTPDGSRATPTEFALPGPFAGYPEPAGQVVLELPNAAILKAQAMEADGESITAIAREYYGVKRPNGTQTKEIRELLDRAKSATNAR